MLLLLKILVLRDRTNSQALSQQMLDGASEGIIFFMIFVKKMKNIFY